VQRILLPPLIWGPYPRAHPLIMTASGARLTAFVGRSFLDSDKAIWHEMRDIFDSFRDLGFHYEDAKGAQLKAISEKVKEGIQRNSLYIGILTRRHRVVGPATSRTRALWDAIRANASYRWTTSEWIIEEIGYAIGRDKKTLLLIEAGVIFPITDLDADTEFVTFDRADLKEASMRLTQIINKLIATEIGAPAPSAEAAPPIDPQEAATGAFERFDQIVDLARAGEIKKADQLQEELLSEDSQKNPELFHAALRRFRASAGDSSSLEWLESRATARPPTASAVEQLARFYADHGQSKRGIQLLSDSLVSIAAEDRAEIVFYLVELYRDQGESGKAEGLLQNLLAEGSNKKRARAFAELAQIAKARGDVNLRLGALEKAVELNPLVDSRRFDLAHLYEESKRPQMAVFHYRLLAQDEHAQGAKNNLAVALGGLGLKAKEVEGYRAIAGDYPLAKANLAVLYAEAGFLDQALEMAVPVISSGDEQAVERANYVISRVGVLRREANSILERLDKNTRAEREFRAAYADAYALSPPRAGAALALFPQGEMMVECDSASLTGSRVEEINVSSGLIRAAMYGLRGSDRVLLEHRFSAQLHGCAGSYKYTIGRAGGNATAASLLTAERTVEGLLTIDRELRVLTLFQQDVEDATPQVVPLRSTS
jgi:tetratricopeptide (TPR) repeat protein